jgi:mannose-6-phosphate isomerase-like protein (cupin superfamily)
MSTFIRKFDRLDQYQPPHHSGTINRKLCDPSDGLGDVSVVRGSIAPGGSAHPHFHEHSDQIIFIISGQCKIASQDADGVLGANDTAFLRRNAAHHIEVVGDEALELLNIYLPALRPDDTYPAD